MTVLDDLFTGQAETIPTGAEFVQGSVTDADLVERLVAENWLIFHLAARTTSRPRKNPRDDFATNIGGTLNILLAARKTTGRPGRLHRLVVDLRQPALDPDQRGRPIVPLSPYAVSKLGGEHYCFAFYESYGMPTAVVRYSNVYGPGQRPDNPYCGVVSKFLVDHRRRPLADPRRRRADPRLHLHR